MYVPAEKEKFVKHVGRLKTIPRILPQYEETQRQAGNTHTRSGLNL